MRSISLFQSTHPRRVWLVWGVSFFSLTVSIHTPTQGVTYQIQKCVQMFGFNPHTHAGCDFTLSSCINVLLKVSIHTPTQGVTILTFKPTHKISVSIHTPTQGVTKTGKLREKNRQFQSTHPRRVWHYRLENLPLGNNVSIHTPTQGVTISSGRTLSFSSFNPHTHAGCDKCFPLGLNLKPLFQSTHPRRVWRLQRCNGCLV